MEELKVFYWQYFLRCKCVDFDCFLTDVSPLRTSLGKKSNQIYFGETTSTMLFFKQKAKSEGLWNLFLPGVSGLSQLDYALLAEITGRCPFAPEVFNCSAPGK